MKRALITGALGQDGSYLAEYLLSKGYSVYGMVRTSDAKMQPTYVHGVNYLYGDLRDALSIANVIKKSAPDEIYNLAGQVFVPTSWLHPAETFDVNVGGLARILACVEKLGMQEEVRVYQASTSEMYGNAISQSGVVSLDESDNMNPVSPYGVSKLAAHKLVDVYRQKGFYVVSGILFNHESPRRGTEMVTRKISLHVAQWFHDQKVVLRLGSMTPQRDWGFAGDFVRAMHAMLQQGQPDDYVIGTGKSYSIEDFLRAAIEAADLDYDDIMNQGLLQLNCSQYGRTPELNALCADYSKARRVLEWEPKVSFLQLVEMMVNQDIVAMEDKKHVSRA